MKKKILGGIVILIIALSIGINFNFSKTSNGIALENIEALANGEGGTSKKYTCYSILEGSGTSVFCSDCLGHTGTPPWYHFGSTCTR